MKNRLMVSVFVLVASLALVAGSVQAKTLKILLKAELDKLIND